MKLNIYKECLHYQYKIKKRTGFFQNLPIIIRQKLLGKFEIPYIEFFITTKCNLRCGHCSNLIPYIEKKEQIDFSEFKYNLNLLLSKVDCLYRLKIHGGEVFLHPELCEMVQYADSLKKIRSIRIATNGTVLPPEKALKVLAASKAIVQISDYPSFSDRAEKIVEIFKSYGVKYIRLKGQKWRDMGNSEETNPMILAKCCHDLDIINWLIGDTCVSVSSYGSLSYFTEENAPPQSAEYCCDCKLQNCLYNAIKRSKEMKGTMNVPYGFDYSDVSIENYLRDKSNDYGRCVFRSGNNVVDHQSVAMNFRNGATATLNMHTFAEETYRSTKVIGTRGEIIGRFGERSDDSITVNVIAPLDEFKPEIIEVGTGETGHGGGDGGLIDSFF